MFVLETVDLKARHTPPYLLDATLALLDEASDKAGLKDVEIVFAIENLDLAGKSKSKVGMKQIKSERPRVLSEIDRIKPDLVVCFGPIATASVFGKGNLAEGGMFRQAHYPFGFVEDVNPDGTGGAHHSGPAVYVTIGLSAIRWKAGLRDWLIQDVNAAVKGWGKPEWGDYTILQPGTLEWDVIPLALAESWVKQQPMGYDLETFYTEAGHKGGVGTSMWAPDARIRMAIISDRIGRAWVVQAKPDSTLPQWVYDLIEDPTIIKAGSNIKYDALWHKRFGRNVRNIWDTSTHEHIIDESNPRKDLKSLTFKYVPKLADYARDQRRLVKERGGWEHVADNEMYLYAGGDGEASVGAVTAQMMKIRGDLDRPARLFRRLYESLVEMEHNGTAVNLDTTRELDILYRAKLDVLRAEIVAVLGPINPNSPPALAKALKAAVPGINLRLKDWQKIVGDDDDADLSTKRVILEREAHKHPILKTVLEFRSTRTRHSTFIKGILEKYAILHHGQYFVHPSFNTDRVETFRLSSSRPNGQNYPVNEEDADLVMSIKRQFVSRFEGGCILEGDQTQLEIRVAAWLSGDKKMLAAIATGEDIHTSMAAIMLDKPMDQVTKDERHECKARTFLILYGGGAKKLAQDLGISRRRAERLINEYFATFKELKAFIDRTHVEVHKTLDVTTPFGFKRRFVKPDHWDSPDGWTIQRQAFNTKSQNTAACLTYCAQVWYAEQLKARGFKSILDLQVHDSLKTDVYPGELAQVAALKKQAMEVEAVRIARDEYGVDFTVPLACELKTGPNWGAVEVMKVA